MSLKAIQSRLAFLLWLIVLMPLSACVDTDGESQKAETKGEPQKSTIKNEIAPAAEQAAVGPPKQNSGQVKSVEMASGYSYIEVDISGDIFWLATAMTAVKPGDEIAWKDYAVMSNFNSKGLNREFAQILFVDRVFPKAALTQQTHSGKVIEALNAAGYTYIQVEEKGNRVWLAVPQRAVEVGQLISWSSTQPMRNFNSQSLDRTFDEIYFVSGISQS